MSHPVSRYCVGVKCQFVKDPQLGGSPQCGDPASHKVGEEIFDDDPIPHRHNLTAYLCCRHYRLVMGGSCD